MKATTIQLPLKQSHLTDAYIKDRVNRINHELKQGGAVRYDLILPETHYLRYVIRSDEHIKGSVYGKHATGRGVLVATNQRVLFIDKKPLFVHIDEIGYA